MREFTVGGANLTVANNSPVSLIMIMPVAAPGLNITIIRAWTGQSANATSAQQRIEHTTQVAAFPTTAVSATPVALNRSDAVSGIAGAATIAAGKCGVNVGTEGAGTKTTMWTDAFNVLIGYFLSPAAAFYRWPPAIGAAQAPAVTASHSESTVSRAANTARMDNAIMGKWA